MGNSEVDDFLENYKVGVQESSAPKIVVKKNDITFELTEELVKKYSVEVLNYLIDDIRFDNDFEKRQITLKLLTDMKRTWWPATQRQITTNLDNFNIELSAIRKAIKEDIELEEERKRNLKNEGIIENIQ